MSVLRPKILIRCQQAQFLASLCTNLKYTLCSAWVNMDAADETYTFNLQLLSLDKIFNNKHAVFSGIFHHDLIQCSQLNKRQSHKIRYLIYGILAAVK